MHRILFAAVLAIIFGACSTSSVDDAAPATTNAPTTTTTTTTIVGASDTVDAQDTPAALALADPVVAADPGVVELDDEVTINTTVYALTMDAGTEWELPLYVPVPTGWTWDPSTSAFSDGSSRMTLTTGCAPDCVATSWNVTIVQEGSFLHDPMAGLPTGGSEGFGSSDSSETGSTSHDRTFDDGTGRTATAHFHHDGARWLGCTADVSTGAALDVPTMSELCEAIEADWSTVVSNTSAPVIVELLTESVAALLNKATIDQPFQIVALDEDGEHNVSMQLPADASVDVDGVFGTEVSLADTSIFTDMELNAACDGLCTGQDWGAKINGTNGELGRMRAAISPKNDSPIDSGWLLSGPTLDDDEHLIGVVRWDDTADHYFSCIVEVDRDDVDKVDDLIAVCLTAEPLWFG